MPFALTSDALHQPHQDPGVHGRPQAVVSTPVADVVERSTAPGRGAHRRRPAGVRREVQAALDETAAARETRIVAERAILARNSWDAIATRMDERMAHAEPARQPRLRPPARPSTEPAIQPAMMVRPGG